MRIHFFEKWNKEAGMKEFSLTRLQMAVFTAFTGFFIWQFYIVEGNSVTVNSLVLMIIMFLACFFPKAIKDLSDIKDKLG